MIEQENVAADNLRRFDPALLLFWAAAGLMLFAGLGSTSLWGSEDRWAEISRIMVREKDFFHPCINGVIYFDKPLLSYWLIAIPSLLVGVVNEFMIRLPSALAGIIGLWATYKLGMKLWDRRTALLSAWIMLGCLGFVFWARKGAADLENLTSIILAVCWYYYRKDRPGFVTYFVFMLICVIGAHTKGLPAIGVPVIAIIPDLLRHGNWKKHLRWTFFAAAVLSLAVYLLPFILAASIPMPEGWKYPTTFDGLTIPDWAAKWRQEICGLYLVWKENVARFIDPFDHKAPFYCYTYELPRILIPWCVMFIAALYFFGRNYFKMEEKNRQLLETIVLIFLLFSASGSRRWYYILPIVPFCALLTAAYISNRIEDPFKDLLRHLYKYVVITASALLCLMIPAILIFNKICTSAAGSSSGVMQKLSEFTLAPAGMITCTALAIIALIIWICFRRNPDKFDWIIGRDLREWAPLALNIWLLQFLFSCVLPIMLEPYRTEKNFALELKGFCAASQTSPSELAFFTKPATKVVFYMEMAQPVPEPQNADDLIKLMKSERPPRYIITQNRYINKLKETLPEYKTESPVLKEKVFAWEKDKEKLSVWEFIKQGNQ